MIENIRDAINEFDDEHVTKQIILIGMDGAIRHIEFDIQEDEND